MISFSIHNFGCRVNQAESFLWADELQKNGLQLEEDCAESDLVVVNSCTLTSRADRDVRQFIRKIPRLNPKAKMVVTGCLAERAYREFKSVPNVWRVFRNTEKYNLPSRIISLVTPYEKTRQERSHFRSRALLKIQDGCDFRCTFCVIPGVRGKSRSFPRAEIVSQAERFVSQGFREVVLTGIHLCSYGIDSEQNFSLLELLLDLERIDGLGKLRLSSLDPRFLTTPLLGHITSSDRICQHFHISLQHGSDAVLRRMGRKISVVDYDRILSFICRHSPEASLGTDILIGFPGETEDDYKKTHLFLEQSPLTYFHVFPYSPRPGTPASSWPQVDSRKKSERARVLRKLSQQKNIRFRRHFLGRELEGIVIKKKGEGAEILTSNYIKMYVPHCAAEERKEVTVMVDRVNAGETHGRVL